MVLFSDLALTRLESWVLEGQVVNFGVDLDGELLHVFDYHRVGLLEQFDLMAMMGPVDNTLGTDGRCLAVKAEVLHLFLGMIFAEVTNVSVWLVLLLLDLLTILAFSVGPCHMMLLDRASCTHSLAWHQRCWPSRSSGEIYRPTSILAHLLLNFFLFILLIAIVDLVLKLKEFSCALRVKNCGTLAVLAYHGLLYICKVTW